MINIGLGFRNIGAKIAFWCLLIPLLIIGSYIADAVSVDVDDVIAYAIAEFCFASVAYGIATGVDAALDHEKEIDREKRIDHGTE